MNLIDENEERVQEANKKKISQTIIIAIAVLVSLVIILLIISSVKKSNTLKLSVNGSNQSIPAGLFYMKDSKNIYVDESGRFYISVKKLSQMLGVEYFNDEYKKQGEDTRKCYIKTENEYTSYIADSSEIYKAIVIDEQQEIGAVPSNNKNKNEENNKTTEYEYFTIQDGVKLIDNEIYASNEAIELGFNVIASYDKSKKVVNILTIEGLESIAQSKFSGKSVSAVTGDKCSYENKRLLKYGLVLISNAENCYGIADYNNFSDGSYIVSCKYSDIRFCEDTGYILVTTLTNPAQGILKINLDNPNSAEKVVEPEYQLVKKIDEKNNLYIIKINGKYGVISIKDGEIKNVLKPIYQKIGVDTIYENMDNKYLINDKYIPVEMDNRWGIASKDGNMLVTPQYPGIGCNVAESSSDDGVIVIPDLMDGADGIVFLTNEESKLYSIVNVNNATKIGPEAAEIYSVYQNNKREYYMKVVYNEISSITLNIYNQFGTNKTANTVSSASTQNQD